METLTLEIQDVAYGGRGVARHEGFVVFVPGAMTGETVEAELTRRHRKFGEARLVRVLSPSPSRVEPACPLAGTCPGCAYQHLAYDAEVELKQAQLEQLLARIGKQQVEFDAPLPSPVALGYRNKIVLHSSPAGEPPALGYVGEDNHSILDVPSCPLAVEAINSSLGQLRDHPRLHEIVPPDSRLTMRHTEVDGVRSWVGKPREAAKILTETTSLGQLLVPEGSFFQVNAQAGDVLLGYISGVVKTLAPAAVLDLYCGSGSLAIAAAAGAVGPVVGIDRDGAAVAAAEDNAAARDLQNVTFMTAPADKGLERQGNLLKLSSAVLICDPPRSGLDKPVVKAIGKAGPAVILYVSCAPDTLARDMARLAEFGYAARQSRLIDMFPRTACFESVTELRLA